MGNFVNIILDQANRYPDRIAIVEPTHNGDNANSEKTYSRLSRRIYSISAALKKQGVSSKSRILLLIPVSVDFYASLLAVLHTGACAVLIDPGFNRNQFKKCLNQVKPDAVISTDRLLRYRWLFPPLLKIKRKFTLQETGIGLTRLLTKDNLGEVIDGKIENFDQESTALITFTSGSSGIPKGVVRTHATLINQHQSLKSHFPPLVDQVDLPGFPVVTLHNLGCGHTTILPQVDFRAIRSVQPVNIVRQINEHKINSLTGSPAYISSIIRFCKHENITLSGVRQLGIGGAPVEPELCREILSVFHQAECQVIYGCSEAEPISSIGLSEILELTDNQENSGRGYCVGRRAQVTQVKILPMNTDGLPLPPEISLETMELSRGEIGEIAVSGPHVSEKYYQNDGENSISKILDESSRTWHRTGDVGYVDNLDRIWLMGRTSNLVSVEDMVIYPLEVESILNRIQGVRRSALSASKQGNPVLWIESVMDNKKLLPMIQLSLESQGMAIRNIYFTEALPVDARHNSKIDYPLLRRWTVARGEQAQWDK